MASCRTVRLAKFSAVYAVCSAYYWHALRGWPWLFGYGPEGPVLGASAHVVFLAAGYAAGVFLLANEDDGWYLPAVLAFALAEGLFVGTGYLAPRCAWACAAVIGFALGAALLALRSFLAEPEGGSEALSQAARRLLFGLAALGCVFLVVFGLCP